MLIFAEENKVDDIINILKEDMELEIKIEEKEKDEVDFLDMKIIKNKDNRISTKHNKKAYKSNRTINATSNQPWEIKTATL